MSDRRFRCVLYTLLLPALALATFAAEQPLPRRGMFGIQLAPMSPNAAAAAGLTAPRGILLSGTFPNTPAATSGLLANDVILAVNGEDVADLQGFLALAGKYAGGETVTLRVWRDKSEKMVELTLADRAREASPDFEILYDDVAVDGFQLRTLVTKPRAEGRRPAILYIPDVSSQSVDWWAPNMNPPAKALLHELTRAGFVTMRVEPAGVGDSRGPNALDADFDAYLPWYRAGFARMREYPFVDPAACFIYGERMGSIAAAHVAQTVHPRGVITFAAISRTFAETHLENTRRHNWLERTEPAEVDGLQRALLTFFMALGAGDKTPGEIIAAHPELAPLAQQLIQNDTYVFGRHYRFMQQICGRDPLAAWREVTAPVLVLWGEADWVTGELDSIWLAGALNQWHRRQARYMKLPHTDAMYQEAKDFDESYLNGPGGAAFNPAIIKGIAEWIEGLPAPRET